MKEDLYTLGARTLLHKKSHTPTCFKYCKPGTQQTCRFGFPRELVPQSSFDRDSGEIKLRRLDRRANNYNPWITIACRGNNDIQFIGSGASAMARVYYITNYVTKSELTTHSAYAMGAAAVQSFENPAVMGYRDTSSLGPIDRSRLLRIRCFSEMATHQELSGQMVSTLLLDLPDHYTSEKFRTLYLASVTGFLTSWAKQHPDKFSYDNLTDEEVHNTDKDAQINDDDCCNEELFTLTFASSACQASRSSFIPTNLRIDYTHRSNELSDMCLYDFVAQVIHEPLTRGYNLVTQRLTQSGETSKCAVRSQRRHPQSASHHLRLRDKKNFLIPVLSGQTIPRKDSEVAMTRDVTH